MEFNDIEFPPGVKDLSSDMNPAEMVKALKVHPSEIFVYCFCFLNTLLLLLSINKACKL